MPPGNPSSPDNGSEPSGLGWLPSNPRFAAHFTTAIYDPDDSANDEIAPFGGDEGADLYAEWAERVDELESLSLRQMLELDEDPGGSRMGPSEPDEIVIAAAFIHLRATGWIDPEGASWLHAALVRSDQDNPDAEFAVMLDDLATYSNKPPKARKQPAEKTWIRIQLGPGDGPLTRWCRQTEKALDTDPAWSQWWSTTPFAALECYPNIDDLKGRVTLKEERDVLIVLASTPRLGRIVRRHFGGTITLDTPPLPSLLTLPHVRDLLDTLLLSALRTAAHRKRLQTPPAHLPPLITGQ